MPRIMMNKTRGARPGGGGPFRASPIAHTTIRRTAVPTNYTEPVSGGAVGINAEYGPRRRSMTPTSCNPSVQTPEISKSARLPGARGKRTAYVENRPAVPGTVRMCRPPSTRSMAWM